MFLPEISEQALVRLVICSDSTREFADCMRVFLQEKDYHMAVHLPEQKLQDMDSYI